MIKKALLSLVLACATLLLPAQISDYDMPEIIAPSPTVSNLMRFEEVPVNYYTGQPDISIPLFSKQLDKGLSLNLALRYNTQGVMIDNLSGWVGTGWSMEIGGVISRTVRGIPDEFKKTVNSPTKTGVLHNPDFWNYNNLDINQKEEFNWNAKGTPLDNYDTELDLYQFSLLGTSGRFIIVKEAGVLKAKLLSKDQNVKIHLIYDTTTYAMNSFVITDAYGYKYTFDEKEVTTSTTTTTHKYQGDFNFTPLSIGSNEAVVVNTSAWHLSKVTTSNNIELASIDYISKVHAYYAPTTTTINDIQEDVSFNFLQNAYNKSILKPAESRTKYYTSIQSLKPTKITFKDDTSVEFLTGNNHPETNGSILQDVIINDKTGTENKRYELTYSTIVGRLWLDKVDEKAGSETLSHTLDYIDKNGLSTYGSASSDVWGYNNATTSTSSACTGGLTYDPNAIKKGLLWKITYPTGGSKEFVFEPNTFSYEGNQVIPPSDYLLSPINVSAAEITRNFWATDHQIYSLPQTVTFTHAHNVYISVSLTNGAGYTQHYLMALNKTDGTDDNIVTLDNTNCKSVPVVAGTYQLKLIPSGSNTLDPHTVSGSVRLDYGIQNATVSESLLGGGVRIKEIVFKDVLTEARKILYDYSDPTNSNKSSGAVDSRQGNLSKDYPFQTKKKLFSTTENIPAAFGNNTITYDIKTKGANAQLTKGSYIGYKNVKVSEENNGYSLYTYTTPQDYPSPSGVFTYPFKPYPNLDHKRGQLQKSKVFNHSGNQLKEVANTYTNYEETINTSIKVTDEEQCYYSQFYDTYANYISNTPTNTPTCVGGFGCGILFTNCGNIMISYSDAIESSYNRVVETATKDYTYDNLNNQLITERVEQYGYNSTNFQQNDVTTYFEGVGINEPYYRTQTFFPVGGYPSSDYTSTQNAAISKMVTLNKINVPIYTKTYKNNTLLTKSQNVFREYFPDLVELEEVKTAKGTQGLESRLTYHSYYDNGKVKEVSKKDGSRTVYIWGYNETLPIAKIDNATYAEVSSQINNLHTESNNDNDSTFGAAGTEGALREALKILRNTSSLSDALVTTFTYDPVKGVTSVTDPTGQTMYYHYDSLNRLEMVTDIDNKVISKNTYNYKN